ncbi:MAG: alpha/beta hydrolase, partial [Candidatus Rokuibacteriota bacterium]
MEEPLIVHVPDGPALEARLAPVSTPRGGFVICHPHPLHGGDMDNPVVIRAAEVARAAGHATLRFNFRGAGASQGTHDKGRGEQD